ncbi:MAG: transglutaminase-like domain-containing protein [Nitriliruptoraceae bacterium]
MTAASRDRLVRLARRNDVDLAEAALLCAVGADPDLDIEVELLRLDALADALEARHPPLGYGRQAAAALADYLAGELGFGGEVGREPTPEDSLLHHVVATRRGLPITLSIVYAAIARRIGVPAYLIGLPGHVVTGIPDGDRPVVLDPFHGGRILDEGALSERVTTATAGQLAYRRSMLRPSPTVNVVRRLLNNLTRDLRAAGAPGRALWTVELKLALPNRVPADHRQHGELLAATGRFDRAAAAFERFLELTAGDTPERETVRRAAIEARSRMN